MKGVVDDRLGPGRLMVLLDHSAQRLPPMLRGERDHRGGAAKRRRDGRAVEIIGADHAGGGALLDVAMAVDPARQYKPAGRIDLPCARTEVLAESRHRAVLDADVTQSRIGGG